MDKLFLELEDLGFPILADWIHEGEINYQKSLSHIEENKQMMDDKEDEEAFDKAKQIVMEIFKKN